jgi:hypothetical protein
MGNFNKSRRENWGIEGYYVPNNEWFHHKPRTFISKSKKENIIEYIAKSKKDLPAPNSYKPFVTDWTKTSKGKFLKGKRVT